MHPCYGPEHVLADRAQVKLSGVAHPESAFGGVRTPTVAAVTRQCSKIGCSEPATVTLSYHYAHAQVWLDPLHDQRDPHAYDLCERHAGRLTAPRGWHVRDRRGAVPTGLVAV
jgi:hypothetical protein